MANTFTNGVVESSNSDPASLGGFAYASSIRQTYKVDNKAALDALGGVETGDLGFLKDTQAFYFYNGTTWVLWYTPKAVTFAPIVQGLTQGNGTWNYAYYTVIGGARFVEVSFTLGSTSAVTGVLKFAYPTGLAPSSAIYREEIGEVSIRRAGTYTYQGRAVHDNTDSTVIFATYVTLNGRVSRDGAFVGPTNPNAWASGDVFIARWQWQES